MSVIWFDVKGTHSAYSIVAQTLSRMSGIWFDVKGTHSAYSDRSSHSLTYVCYMV